MMRKLLIILVALAILGCDQEQYCVKCTETFYRDENLGPIVGGGYVYSSVFIREVTYFECTDDYIGPYIINGQASNPKDGTDFYWSFKKCVE